VSSSLDFDHIARVLGAERCGKVTSRGGYFGALQLAAEVATRFHTPAGGGNPIDPAWNEEHTISLSRATLKQLEQLAEKAHATPMQVAAILLEQAVQNTTSGQE
jgi:hypothetical protein